MINKLRVFFFLMIIFTKCFSQNEKISVFSEVPFEDSNKSEVYISSGSESVPYSFAIDEKGFIYLPDNYKNKIIVFKNDSLYRTFKVPEDIRKIKYDQNRKSIFLFTVPKNEISEFNTNGVLLSNFSIGSGNIIDYHVVDSLLFAFFEKRYNLVLRSFSLSNGHLRIEKKIDIKNFNKPLIFEPTIAYNNGYFILPSDSLIYFIDLNGELRKKTVVNGLENFSGILHFENDCGIAVPLDGPLILREFDLDNGVFNSINMVPYLENIFGGKYGKDFMVVFGGFNYDIKYQNEQIYLMGSNNKKTVIFKILP